MRKMLVVLVMVFMFAGSVQAAPFLVCDPVAAGTWDKIEIVIDSGAPALVDPVAMGGTDTRIRLYYDLNTISVGTHNVILRGKKGVWYSTSTPFSFVRPAVAAPSSIGLTE